MAAKHHFLLEAIIMVTLSLRAIHSHECDCSKYTKGGAGCGTYTAAVQQCIMTASQLPPDVDVPMICSMYNETSVCMANAAATCANPPADSKQWTDMWASMESTAKNLCSHSPDDTSCGNFESQAATCLMDILGEGGPGTSLDEICRVYRETALCMDPLVSKCPDEAQSSDINKAWQMMKQQMQGMPC